VRLTIRWKFALSVILPMVVIYSVVLMLDSRQLHRAAIEQIQTTVKQRAANLADRYDIRLEMVRQAGEGASGFLASRGELAPAPVLSVLRLTLRRTELALAAAVAVEPDPAPGGAEGAVDDGSGDGGRAAEAERAAAPFSALGSRREAGGGRLGLGERLRQVRDPVGGLWMLRRDNDGLGRMVTGETAPLAPEAPEAIAAARATRQSVWSGGFREPRLDGEATALLATPILDEQERVTGTMLLWFPLNALGDVLREAGFRGEAVTVMDREGRFLSHPDPSMLLRGPTHALSEPVRDALTRAGEAAMQGESVVVPVPDIQPVLPDAPEGEHWIAFSPIRSAGWGFVAALPQDAVVRGITQRLTIRALTGAVELLLLVGIVVLLSTRLVRPIEQLADAVGELARGNLDVRVTGVRNRDEVGDLARGFNQMVARVQRLVQQIGEQTAVRERVNSELRIAREIQVSLLPRELPAPDGFELCGVNVPAREIAGDFYDYFRLPGGDLMLVIADVAGKGVPAAMVMAVTRTIIRDLAAAGMDLARIVDRANRVLLADTGGGVFVTMILCRYSPVDGRIVYVNAGHPTPVRVSPEGRVTGFGGQTGPLVGAMESTTIGQFEQAEDRLDEGETLVLFTDGVSEARSSERQMLGEAAARSLIGRQTVNRGVEAACDAIVAEINAFQDDHLIDDVTLVMLRRTATPATLGPEADAVLAVEASR